jgi:hypothetical protein
MACLPAQGVTVAPVAAVANVPDPRNVPMRRVFGTCFSAHDEIHSPSGPIARHREREQEVNFMVESG